MELTENLLSKAGSVRDTVQNQVVDASLKLNEKQGDLLKKLKDNLLKSLLILDSRP